MKSPFPGMDQYLEAYWGGVHAMFIVYACDQLHEVLPSGLRARIDAQVSVSSAGDTHDCEPDVYVHTASREGRAKRYTNGHVALAEPRIVSLRDVPRVKRSIRIVDARSKERVITSIEFLSPWNKRGRGREEYVKKRTVMQRGKANIVEIDLNRSGPYILLAPEEELNPEEWSAYRASVWRVARPRRVEFYALPIQKRLPAIRVPLRPKDADVPLNLQALVEIAYAKAYPEDFDYSVDPVPPLPPADAAWADKLLRAKGLR